MLRSTALAGLLASIGAARKCRDFMIPMSLTSQNAVLNLEPQTSGIDVTNFYLNLGRQSSTYMQDVMEGKTEVSGDYELAATYCEPDHGPGEYIQVMTHGIGFDRSYFDLPFNNYNYSYVARAVDDYGYSTLTYDRLGVGSSSKVDTEGTINELQISLEIAALKELTSRLSSGNLHDIGCHYGKKIVHVGHSFGSAITYNLVNDSPELSSGIILTGFSQIPDYMGLFALGGNFVPVTEVPALAAKYSAGYVAAGTKMAVHNNFLAPGDFDPAILDYLYQNGQPNTPGEILTVGQGTDMKNKFSGPSMIITGDRDVPFCGGDCMATSAVDDKFPNLIAASKPMFPSASSFNATVVPHAGHGLFAGYSHASAFDSIFAFLDAHL